MYKRQPARRYFPTAQHDNYGFYLLGLGASKDFSTFGIRHVPDLNFYGSEGGQFFPRFRWEPAEDEGTIAFDLGGEVVEGYRRIDNITDEFHRLMQDRYGSETTKDEIFFFLYGLLHSPEYRERYEGCLLYTSPSPRD